MGVPEEPLPAPLCSPRCGSCERPERPRAEPQSTLLGKCPDGTPSLRALPRGLLQLTAGSAQFQPSRCPRTVLLSGIPDVLGEEPMRDALEIHFQKASRGGGEVDALAYVPLGQHGVAVFTEDAG